MANTTQIQILRSSSNVAPLSLASGELAYSFLSNTLFIGGTSNNVISIGGRYYSNIIDTATSSNTPFSLVKRDEFGSSKFYTLSVDGWPGSANSVTHKEYVDAVVLGSYGSIYYGTVGTPFYSNVLTSSVGVDITANTTQVATYRDYGIYFVPDLHVTGNTYTNYIFATGQVDGEEFHANTKILVGEASRQAAALPNSLAQFSANSEYYVQINGQNLNGNGSADFVITADVGTDVDYYIDMGMGGSTYSFYTGNNSPMEPLAGYLLVQGSTVGLPGGNLVIGTTSPQTKLTFMTGGYETDNIQMTMSNSGVNIWHTLTATEIVSPTINAITSNLSSSYTYTDTANTYLKNRIDSSNSYSIYYTDTANTWLQANDAVTLEVAKSWTNFYTDSANTWLQANDRLTLAAANSYTDTANTNLKSYVDSEITANFDAAKSYTDAANTWLQANDRFTLTVANSYTLSTNTWLQANDKLTLTAANSYTDAANTWLQSNDTITLLAAQSYTDTANTNLKLYTDNNITSNINSANASLVIYVNSNITANLNTAQTYTDTANTNLRLYVDGKVTSNLATAQSYTDTANTNLRLYTDDKITANLATAQSYTDTANTNLRLYTDSKISANLFTAQSYTDTANTNLKSYVDGEITANFDAAKAYTDTANTFVTNLSNGNLTTALNYTNTANTFLQANDSITLGVAKNYTDIANVWLQGNIFNTLTTATNYTDTANTFNQANTGAGLIGANTYTDTSNTSLRLYVNDKISSNLALAYANTGTANIIAVSASSYANGAFQAANSASSYANSAYSQANTANLTAEAAYSFANTSNVYFYGVNAYQNTFITTANNTANAAYAFANTVNAYSYGVNDTQNTNITIIGSYANSSYIHANSAFDTANLKLNTSGGNIAFINVASNVYVGSSIDFNPNPTGEASAQEGRIFYDKFSKAFGGYNDTPRYIHFGRDVGIRVYNNTGSTINAASPVFILNEPASGGAPHIAIADATTAANSEVIGLTQTEIANGTYGMVISQGLIEYLDTTSYSVGQELYLSTTPGQFTTTVPSSPNIPLNLGYIGSVSPLYGEIIVNIHLMEGKNKTTGSILFARNQLIDEDPDHLYWDYANNSLGIGTSSPAANLHVVGSGLFTGNVIISGNLLVSNAQSITTTELTVGGNTVILNSEVTGTPTSNAVILVNRGSSTNVYIQWNEVEDHWFLYSGIGNPGHILDSEETFSTWIQYSAADAYEKSTHPIGGDLANATNEHATAGFAVANIAYHNALSGYIHANSAYISQNTTGVYANTGLQFANSASSYANTALQYSNSASSYSNSAYVHANSAYVSQNTTGVYANTGLQFANSAGIYANTGLQFANSAGSYANSAYLQANATTQFAHSGTFTTSSTSQVAIDSWSSSTYRSATYQLQFTSGSNYHVLDMKFMHDGTTVWWNGYGELWNNSKLATFSATINGGNVDVLITPTNSVTVIKFVRSLINT
jgi:hypothetical protein